MDFKQFLQNLPAFHAYLSVHLDTLAQAMRVEDYPKGHEFTGQGRQGEAMYLLIDGNVSITEHDDIADLVHDVKELHNGELFGLLSLIDNMPAAATCTALSPVKVASLPRAEFTKLFQSAPPIGYPLQYMVAVQLARDLQNRNRSIRALLKRETVSP
jgi:CRP/FNR family cyclic AMP-dependent transcriptional regulator